MNKSNPAARDKEMATGNEGLGTNLDCGCAPVDDTRGKCLPEGDEDYTLRVNHFNCVN